MGLLDLLFGRPRAASSRRSWPTRVDPRERMHGGTGTAGDAQALERYKYLVSTAPPHVVEQVHREAFSRLTPEQRRRALHELNASMPPWERLTRDDPASLGRLATRAELMRPGSVVTAFGGMGLGGVGMGGLLAGGLLTSFVGSAMGSMLAHQWMDGFHGDHGFEDGYGSGYGDGYEAGQDAVGDMGEPVDTGEGDITSADWDGGGGGFDDSIL